MWRYVARTRRRPRPRAPGPMQTTGRSLSVLTHSHLEGLVKYEAAHSVQEQHRLRLLEQKSQPNQTIEPPLLVSFEAAPTFTLGRRQDRLAAHEAAKLKQPLHVRTAGRSFCPVVVNTHRGGLTTYHGPGQLVLWPVVDLRSSLHPHYGVREYARHLQDVTRRLLAEDFAIQTVSLEDEPGVWCQDDESGPRRKIAALGIHLRRYVAALGVAINVNVSVEGAKDANPWARIVPCGLPDRHVTSIAVEMGDRAPCEWNLGKLASRWAEIFEQGLMDASKRTGPYPTNAG
ncbi:hypothetical protein CDD80_1751 [Ophiocordyceps camponoti-rufipedis]|uniref:Octanoyltransferase n=1 Tax=Ophiocordyceps camponoti-rufipedis TaxID=2004952 RepID=A0A2C5Z560_9HYPO|nr:hypothetical protein CDD80_1751 [Ophiocordyceps camponoti-rufipedis]